MNLTCTKTTKQATLTSSPPPNSAITMDDFNSTMNDFTSTMDDFTSTMSDYATVDALPLYARSPKPLAPRTIPLCPHRRLDHAFFRTLLTLHTKDRIPHNTYLLPPCPSSPTCPQRPTIHITPCPNSKSNRPKLFLTTTYPLALTATPTTCALSTLRKSLNRTRIANLLRHATLRICPHLSLSSAEVAACFSATNIAHTDLQGTTQGDAGFSGACCVGGNGRPMMHVCGSCLELGFQTAWQFVSVERGPTREVPMVHVEVQILVSVGLGGLGEGKGGLDWVAHSLADEELVGWQIGFEMLQGRVGRELFWYPSLQYRLCPEANGWMVRRTREAAEKEESVRMREQRENVAKVVRVGAEGSSRPGSEWADPPGGDRRKKKAVGMAVKEATREPCMRLFFPVRRGKGRRTS